MTKPKLLDLFCGTKLPQNLYCGIIGICSRLSVSTAARSVLSKRHGKLSVHASVVDYALINGIEHTKERLTQFANIVVNNLRHIGRHGNSALWHVPIGQIGQQKSNGHVSCVANNFLYEVPPMPIVNTALNLVRRKLLPKRQRLGGKPTQTLTKLIKKRIWQRTLGYIAIGLENNALRLSACWGANV